MIEDLSGKTLGKRFFTERQGFISYNISILLSEFSGYFLWFAINFWRISQSKFDNVWRISCKEERFEIDILFLLLIKVFAYNTGKTCKRNSFIKVYWTRHGFEVARLAINKEQKYLLLPDHQLAENMILVFGF